jgi:hypothetical protein
MLHVVVLGVINGRVVAALRGVRERRSFMLHFVVVMGMTTLLATLLHAFEAGIWATAYRQLGALSNSKTAMLYSLSALTTYGHAELYLAPHGSAGSAQRVAAFWAHDGLSLRPRAAGVAE